MAFYFIEQGNKSRLVCIGNTYYECFFFTLVKEDNTLDSISNYIYIKEIRYNSCPPRNKVSIAISLRKNILIGYLA